MSEETNNSAMTADRLIFECQEELARINAPHSSSLPGLTRQSMRRFRMLRVSMDPRVKPAGDEERMTRR
jgi:hypothetical protein